MGGALGECQMQPNFVDSVHVMGFPNWGDGEGGSLPPTSQKFAHSSAPPGKITHTPVDPFSPIFIPLIKGQFSTTK